jgi:tetratricopeptide (TPR) repeat protein
MRGWGFAAALLTALLLATGAGTVARAAEPVSTEARAEARALYQKGTANYNVGEFQVALQQFKQAYLIQPDPVFLFNMAQCYRQLGDYQNAALQLRAYLRETPDAPNRTELRRLLTEIEQKADQARAKANAKSAADAEKARAEHERTRTTTPTEPARAAAPPAHPGRTKQIAGLVVGVAGLGLVGGGIGLAVIAKNEGDQLTAAARDHGIFDWDKQQAGKQHQVIGDVLLGVGGAAVATGVVLFVLGRRDASRAERAHALSLTPALAPRLAGVQLSGRF